jgi:hypothetical protein
LRQQLQAKLEEKRGQRQRGGGGGKKGKGGGGGGGGGAAAEQDEGPQIVRYVDLTKTADVYDRVREWNETGKKRFD